MNREPDEPILSAAKTFNGGVIYPTTVLPGARKLIDK